MQILHASHSGTVWIVDYTAQRQAIVRLPFFYYPSWAASVDENTVHRATREKDRVARTLCPRRHTSDPSRSRQDGGPNSGNSFSACWGVWVSSDGGLRNGGNFDRFPLVQRKPTTKKGILLAGHLDTIQTRQGPIGITASRCAAARSSRTYPFAGPSPLTWLGRRSRLPSPSTPRERSGEHEEGKTNASLLWRLTYFVYAG